MLSPNNGSVTIKYTYNNIINTVSGNFTKNDENDDVYTANLADSNFPAILTGTGNVILIGGIIIQLTIESNNDITINEVTFLQPEPYTPPGQPYILPTTSPATNVTFNVNINNKLINYTATFSFVTFASIGGGSYIMYNYSSLKLKQQDSVFSPAALNQAATTKTQTAALLTTLDPANTYLTSDQQIQIANEAGKIAGHVVSIGESITNISTAIANK